ncbi:helix-turn-helix transcriptional regulator [Bacillus nakamurai]|uniref:helix-turn-helix transcriptional regulator n=1 Tax=Bacillus nakamurai TaxID=1793963 RepID=UPI001E4E3734|nr:helix-turn-helix transcriptional regulator [Bacillus nakamurai]MCC9021804.1 helix-turn-helix transcriptional regulator [Bacillus nakamurai]
MEYRVKSKLDQFLSSRGIEKGWLADQINAERASISRWCKNDSEGFATVLPSTYNLLLMAHILNCKVDDLFELIEIKSN